MMFKFCALIICTFGHQPSQTWFFNLAPQQHRLFLVFCLHFTFPPSSFLENLNAPRCPVKNSLKLLKNLSLDSRPESTGDDGKCRRKAEIIHIFCFAGKHDMAKIVTRHFWYFDSATPAGVSLQKVIMTGSVSSPARCCNSWVSPQLRLWEKQLVHNEWHGIVTMQSVLLEERGRY